MMEKKVTTYSMWKSFRDCRKACELRYERNLKPLEEAHPLRFGSLIHECLKIWHRTQSAARVFRHIGAACAGDTGEIDSSLKSDWHLARAMMQGYMRVYGPVEDFEVAVLEKVFKGKIFNPETGASSRSFDLAGKVDGIVRIDGEYWVLEHKTASVIDSGYLERLWMDTQIILYSHYIEKTMGIKISGVLYNILAKARLKQSAGETEEEFQVRRAELIARSKTGKSTAKRKMPETDEDFAKRLNEKYAQPGMFHRERLYISHDQFADLLHEIWELSQSYLGAKRRGIFYRNTSQCFNYGRPCAYFQICRSGENPLVIENHYKVVEPNEELRDSTQSVPEIF